MRTIYMALPFFGLALTLTACDPKVKVPEYKAPEIKIPKPNVNLDDLLKSMKTCNKPESEQVSSAEAVAHTFALNDSIPVQDVETVDCEGNVKSTKHEPVRSFSRAIKLAPPKPLEGLKFIEVENARACSRSVIEVDPAFKADAKLQDGSDKLDFTMITKVAADGDVYLATTGSSLQLHFATNVVDGPNVVVIRYYGKCLEYRKDRVESMSESYNCAKPDLLATRDITLQVKSELVEKPGTFTRRQCAR